MADISFTMENIFLIYLLVSRLQISFSEIRSTLFDQRLSLLIAATTYIPITISFSEIPSTSFDQRPLESLQSF